MRRCLIALIVALVLASPLAAQVRDTWPSTDLLTAAITTATGETKRPASKTRTYQAYGETSAGAGAATVVIEVSNVDNPQTNDWILMGTITLTLGTTRTADGFNSIAPWTYVRARVTAISGTNASVNVRMGQ